MTEILKKFTSQWCYVIFRIIVGLFFFMIGTGKLFGWFAGGGMGWTAGLMTVAGVVESLVGLGIIFGVFSRLAALGGAITMLTATLMVHIPNGINPMANSGERALLYFAAFILIMYLGNGKFSLEKKLTGKKKEVF